MNKNKTMKLNILFPIESKGQNSVLYLFKEKLQVKSFLSDSEYGYLEQQLEKKKFTVHINRFTQHLFFIPIEPKTTKHQTHEKVRMNANAILQTINQQSVETLELINLTNCKHALIAAAEGIALGNYQFNKYFSDAKSNSLNTIEIVGSELTKEDQNLLEATIEGVYWVRDLVNEPQSYLTATKLSEEILEKSAVAGYDVQILDKKQIEALKMGGLLAVNKGSIEPPTFTIISYTHPQAKNTHTIVLVGKGVVFDTGGLSLKPTPNSMDIMKVDMGGAGAVAGAIYAVAKAKVKINVIGLIPATDNRPGLNAYAPGDVIKMFSGKTVEVLNTDAEGRMILADALAYAQKYKPELVIDLATLTGAAMRATGKEAIAAMRTCSDDTFNKLKTSGENTYERLVEFPLWEEYGELIKSDIADMKNIGGADAGAITAGKFLEHFTNYPWIHLDIAGTAHVVATDSYRGKNGTASGVRLLVDFLSNY
jgi:leucyl aminopeptidase